MNWKFSHSLSIFSSQSCRLNRGHRCYQWQRRQFLSISLPRNAFTESSLSPALIELQPTSSVQRGPQWQTEPWFILTVATAGYRKCLSCLTKGKKGTAASRLKEVVYKQDEECRMIWSHMRNVTFTYSPLLSAKSFRLQNKTHQRFTSKLLSLLVHYENILVYVLSSPSLRNRFTWDLLRGCVGRSAALNNNANYSMLLRFVSTQAFESEQQTNVQPRPMGSSFALQFINQKFHWMESLRVTEVIILVWRSEPNLVPRCWDVSLKWNLGQAIFFYISGPVFFRK